MAIQTIQRPYELLVRWGDNGSIAGGQVSVIEELWDSNTLLNGKINPPMPISFGIEAGYPLSDILNQIQITAMSDLELQKLRVFELESQIKALTQQIPPELSAVEKGSVITAEQARSGLARIKKLFAVLEWTKSIGEEVYLQFWDAKFWHKNNPLI